MLRYWYLVYYEDGRVNALYSTPSIYADVKHAANESWPLKTEDFFPYADRENEYWAGYFTSRPAFKGYVRTLSAYYLAARQLEFLRGRNSLGPTTDTLADALAIAQHHDAITGTEQQHVANDYAKRLSIGYNEAEKLVAASLGCLSESTSSTDCSNPKTKFEQVISESIIVQDSEGGDVESQLLPISNVSLTIRDFYVEAYLGISPNVTPKFWLVFPVSVPALGFSTYFVSSVGQTGFNSFMSTSYGSEGSQNGSIEVGQGNLKLIFSEKKLNRYMNSRSVVNSTIQQSYIYYSGGRWDDFQASGAYVFGPGRVSPIQSTDQAPLMVLRGPILDEVHQLISPWIYQITRLYRAKEHAEFEFIVGPIPVDDGIGKEVVVQITSNIMNNKTFYTDSNGRDFIRRIRDYKSDWDLEINTHVSGNYYPINLGIYMEDSDTEISLLVDRPVGGSSLLDGEMELMLHRRLLSDDGRGVAEALDEITCVEYGCDGLTVQGKYYLRIDPKGDGAKWRRSVGQEIYSPLLLAFSEQDRGEWTKSHIATFTAIDPLYSLPDNLAIITLQELVDGSVLLRLAHLYEMGEDEDLSVMANVELRKLFPDRKISKIMEMNLSANQRRTEMEKKRLVWKVEGSSCARKQMRGGPVDPFELVVELGPMEIRTFVITFSCIHNGKMVAS